MHACNDGQTPAAAALLEGNANIDAADKVARNFLANAVHDDCDHGAPEVAPIVHILIEVLRSHVGVSSCVPDF
jgi:hypothetical protein